MEPFSGLRWRKKGLKPIQTKRNGDIIIKEVMRGMEELVEEEPLSPSALLFNEPNFNVHVLAIMGGSCKIYPQVVKDKLLHTLLKHPRFSSVQVLYILLIFVIISLSFLLYPKGTDNMKQLQRERERNI